MGSALSSAWRKLHQPRVYLTVEPILFLFMFASFLSYTVFQELLHHLVCQQTANCSSLDMPERGKSSLWNDTDANSTITSEPGQCKEPSHVEQLVQARASHWLLYVNLATGLPSILVSIFYGAISDQMGRRLFIILPALGSIFNQTVILFVIYFQHSLPLSFLLLGAFASGIGGSFSVINFAVYSYVSDVSAQSKRTIQIGVLESMTFLGATVSLLIGGQWISSGHYSGPLFCIIGIDLVIILYVIVALPESVGVFHRGGVANQSPGQLYPTQLSPGQPYPGQLHPRQQGHPCQLLQLVFVNLLDFGKLLLGSWRLMLLLGMFFVVEINFLGITDTVILFALGKPLCWDSKTIGYFLAAKVFLNGVATLFVLPLLSAVGVKDSVLLVVGMVSGGAGLVLMGSAAHTWMMFIGEWVAVGYCEGI